MTTSNTPIAHSISTRKGAGILPFFRNKQYVLLGEEYRARFKKMYLMEFGGKQDANETWAETALREFREETAFAISLTIDDVLEAERQGHYIHYINPETGFEYIMYYLYIHDSVPIATLNQAAKDINSKHTEKTRYEYVRTDILLNPGRSTQFYPTLLERVELLNKCPRFAEFMQS